MLEVCMKDISKVIFFLQMMLLTNTAPEFFSKIWGGGVASRNHNLVQSY